MKICVMGPQNTGKTTFIKDVLKQFPQFHTSKSTYRDAIIEAGLEDKINKNTCLATQKIILDKIIEELEQSKDNCIMDRSPLDVAVYTEWSQRYNSNSDIDEYDVLNMWFDAVPCMKNYDLIVYIPIDDSIPMKDDILRDTDKTYQKQVGEIFDKYLLHGIDTPLFELFGYKVATIEGDREERVARFIEIINALKGK